ncbi:hypothetical protein [Bacillus weihaiensis]|uniref:Uncharacterized protein n=1 Tax=Bacillus weihaiensis TaxID=1547283 RepID=A0A1L3MTS7_9BACI|nr:hypothetical protein [Bacillus weihaiensis]APH05745.1 hypothetical protein A9C19_13955 [Bacillus weihaiensis]
MVIAKWSNLPCFLATSEDFPLLNLTIHKYSDSKNSELSNRSQDLLQCIFLKEKEGKGVKMENEYSILIKQVTP